MTSYDLLYTFHTTYQITETRLQTKLTKNAHGKKALKSNGSGNPEVP